MLAAARLAGRQAPDRPVQAGRDHRRGMFRRDARHHADRRAGQDPDDQCGLVGAENHRSWQPLHLPHHAERGDAGRRYRDAGLQQAQRAHRRAAQREHQCGHRQRQGVQGHLREARRQGGGRDRLRPRRERFHRDRDPRRGPRQDRRDPDLHAGGAGAEDHAGAGAGRRGEGRRRPGDPARHHLAAVRLRAEGRQGRARLCAHRAVRSDRPARHGEELRFQLQSQVQRRPDAHQRPRLRPDHADRRRGEARRQGRAIDPRPARGDERIRRRHRQRRVRQEQPEHQDGHDPLHGDQAGPLLECAEVELSA